MKRSCALLFALFCLGSIAKSQTILPSPQQNPEWTILTGGLDLEPAAWVYSFGEPFSICSDEWVQVLERNADSCATYAVGYYREEGLQAWFRRDSACSAETYLLYDFALEVGDTFRAPRFYEEEVAFGTALVTGRDILPGGVISLSFYDFDIEGEELSWRMGMGSSRDIFRQLTQCAWGPVCEFFTRLGCLKLNNTVAEFSPPVYFPNCSRGSRRWFVNDSITGGAQTGERWEDAFQRLEDALAIAQCGDEVWVADGWYVPTQTVDRSASFTIPRGVKVYGGFSGNETNLHERNIATHETILSGNIGDLSDSADNSYHVVTFYGSDNRTLLDGFLVEKGYARGTGSPLFARGGGILVHSDTDFPVCTPVIRNCLIRNNFAQLGGGMALLSTPGTIAYPQIEACHFLQNEAQLWGGGIYFTYQGQTDSTALTDGCIFEANTASEGGGVYIQELANNILFRNTSFVRDSATLSGGAISCTHSSGINPSVQLQNCQIEQCYSSSGAGIWCANLSPSTSLPPIEQMLFLSINDSQINNNRADQEGSGIVVENFGARMNISINQTIIEGNEVRTQDVATGVGILNSDDGLINIEVNACNFINNTHFFPILGDGALTIRGFINGATTFARVTNSVFSGNTKALTLTAGGGGGYARSLVANCTFYNNGNYPIATSQSSNPELSDNAVQFINNIVWEPQAILPISSGEGTGLNRIFINNCLFNQLDCDLPGGDASCGEQIIIGEDPLFLAPEINDLRTASCSPARNTGDNGFLDSILLLTDIANAPRVQEELIDLGAYERTQFAPMVSAQVQNASGADQADGSITLSNLEGFAQPVQILWSTADTSLMIEQLLPGPYQAQITDAEGCTWDSILVVTFVNGVPPHLPFPELAWNIFPNPTVGKQTGTLHLENLPAGRYHLLIKNNLGQTFASLPFQLNAAGSRGIEIPLPQNSPSSVYHILVVRDATEVQRIGTWIVQE